MVGVVFVVLGSFSIKKAWYGIRISPDCRQVIGHLFVFCIINIALMGIAMLSNVLRWCYYFNGRVKTTRKCMLIYDLLFFLIWFNFNVAHMITGNVVVFS